MEELIHNLDFEEINYYYHITSKGFGMDIINNGLYLEENDLRSTIITGYRHGNVSIWKKVRKDSKLNGEDAAVQAAPGSYPKRLKKIYWPKFSDFEQKTNT